MLQFYLTKNVIICRQWYILITEQQEKEEARLYPIQRFGPHLAFTRKFGRELKNGHDCCSEPS